MFNALIPSALCYKVESCASRSSRSTASSTTLHATPSPRRERRPDLPDLLARFLIGGLVVIAFSVIGDVFKPKSLGGIFAAAPTIALASITLTVHQHGAAYVSLEGRSMIAGALAFFVYACAVSFVMMRYRPRSLAAASALAPVWAGLAIILWTLWLRK